MGLISSEYQCFPTDEKPKMKDKKSRYQPRQWRHAMRHESKVQPSEVFDVLKASMLVDGFHLVMDLEKSKGSWIVDARDGKRYLDFYTFFATAPLGHNHPRLRDAAFQAKLGSIAVNKPANSDIYTTASAEWVEAFATRASPAYLPHLFT